MKNSMLDRWCKRAWIKFSCCITAFVTVAVLLFWKEWSADVKILAGIAALIPVHVLEEWVFPGGFHFQYNSIFRSDLPDRYPMSRLSDMITNLGATIFFLIITVIGVIKGHISNGIILGSLIFSALEVIVHTIFGVAMYSKFKNKGKTTIYGPGSITAYVGFGVFGTLLLYSLESLTITFGDWIVCAGFILELLIVFILMPEALTKRKDTIFFYENNGYFDRFLK